MHSLSDNWFGDNVMYFDANLTDTDPKCMCVCVCWHAVRVDLCYSHLDLHGALWNSHITCTQKCTWNLHKMVQATVMFARTASGRWTWPASRSSKLWWLLRIIIPYGGPYTCSWSYVVTIPTVGYSRLVNKLLRISISEFWRYRSMLLSLVQIEYSHSNRQQSPG